MDGSSNRDMIWLLLPRDEVSDDVNDFVQTRADFGSSVITFKSIEISCDNTDGQLDTEQDTLNLMEFRGYQCVIREIDPSRR